MKYLVAVDMYFPDRPGGMGRVAWDIALLMRDHGHDVAFVTPDDFAPPGTPPLARHDGMQVLRYHRPTLPAFHPRRHHAAVRAAAEQTRAALGGERWDVVHMHTPFTGEGVQRALGHGPRYIYTMHSPAVLEQRINWSTQGLSGQLKLLLGQGALRRQERRVLRECESIHTLSAFTRDRIEEFYGLGRRVRVIPHWRRPGMVRRCTRSQARRQLGWPDDGPLFFTVRIHGPRYGIDDAIRAAAPLLAPRNARFVIGGDGPLTPAFKRLAGELGCGERVRFTGRLSDEALALAYQAADLFILPTRALECFGLITIEALSYGCPVLSTDAAAIPETMNLILPDFVVPAGDVPSLRARMDDFLSGRLVPPPEEVLTRFVAERFDAAVVTPQILSLLEGPAASRATVQAGAAGPAPHHLGKA